MNNPPILLPNNIIEKEVKPFIYNELKGKNNKEVEQLLGFYIKNCINNKITNSSYNYSYSRAAITVICFFKDLDIPESITINDINRMENQDIYYNETSKRKPVSKRKEQTEKSDAACRTKSKPEPIWVIKDVRNPNLPTLEEITKFNESWNSRSK